MGSYLVMGCKCRDPHRSQRPAGAAALSCEKSYEWSEWRGGNAKTHGMDTEDQNQQGPTKEKELANRLYWACLLARNHQGSAGL